MQLDFSKQARDPFKTNISQKITIKGEEQKFWFEVLQHITVFEITGLSMKQVFGNTVTFSISIVLITFSIGLISSFGRVLTTSRTG